MEQHLIWSHYQGNRPQIFAQAEPRYRFLALHMKAGKVLNIGVGNGGLERIAIQLGREVYSLDPGWDSLINNVKGNRAAAGRVDAIPFSDAVFDTVVCSEVLEHLNSEVLQAGLAEIKRVLKPGGVLVGTVPADEVLSDSEILCPHCGTFFHRWGHVQSFSPLRLEELLRNVGSVEIEYRLFVHWPSLNWKGKFVALLRRAMDVVGRRVSGRNLCFNVQKSR